jgi:translation initiation factor 2 subunit 1
MLYRKTGFPEDDELVMCTVAKVQFNSVFVNIEEYQKQGFIHISEISPGRIRNIRDFVKEGKVIVCKVLNVNMERGQIDLSLRRVNEAQKRGKVEEIKQEQKAEKIVEFIAGETKKDKIGFYNEIFPKIEKEYGMLHRAFQAVAEGELSLEKLGIEKSVAQTLEKEITDRIKPSEVQISGNLTLRSFQPNGVEIIRDAIRNALISENVKITYLGGGKYHINVKAPDYPEAEELMKNATETCVEHMEKNSSEGSFARAEE